MKSMLSISTYINHVINKFLLLIKKRIFTLQALYNLAVLTDSIKLSGITVIL